MIISAGLKVVIDSSALLAILLGEPDAQSYIDTLSLPDRKFMSAINKLETYMVVEARKGLAGAGLCAKLFVTARIEIIAFDSSQSEVALDAWRRFGKGRHPAGLNIGDCAAYALARTLNEPLLYKGDDFIRTDVAPAI